MPEEKKNLIRKGNIWSLLSFISGVLVIFLMLYLEFIVGAFIISVIAVICGIVGFKTNANRIFSFAGLSFGILLLIFLIISIIPSPSSRDKARDARITADMGYLKSLAEIYYTNNNSYVEFEKDSDTIKIREDIIKMGGTNFVINVNPDGKQYCAEVLTNVQEWYCVDSTGVAKRYSYNPSCAINYFTCEQEELEDETAKLVPSEVVGWKTYRNEEYGYEIKHPSDYLVSEENKDQKYVKFGWGEPFLIIQQLNNPRNFNLEEFYTFYSLSQNKEIKDEEIGEQIFITNWYKDENVESIKSITIDNIPAVKFSGNIANLISVSYKYRVIEILTPGDKQLVGEYEKYSKIFNQILSTFRFLE